MLRLEKSANSANVLLVVEDSLRVNNQKSRGFTQSVYSKGKIDVNVTKDPIQM